MLKSKAVDLILNDYNNASAAEKDSYEHTTFKIRNKETIGELLKYVKKGTVLKPHPLECKPIPIEYDSLELPTVRISVFCFEDETLGIVLNQEYDEEFYMKLDEEDEEKLLEYLKNLKANIR